MSVTKGFKRFDEKIDAPAGGSNGPKINYFNIEDKQVVKVWFLDDLDEGTPAVDAGAGVAALIGEHKSPKNYRLRAQCSKETEGRCWACEQAIKHPKTGWGMYNRLYLNVLVDDGKQEPYVAVWSMGVKKNAAWEMLKEEFIDNGTIAAAPWRVRRSGKGTDTTYTIKLLSGDPANFGEYERFDLDTVTVAVSYDEQEAHYNKTYDDKPAEVVEEETAEW